MWYNATLVLDSWRAYQLWTEHDLVTECSGDPIFTLVSWFIQQAMIQLRSRDIYFLVVEHLAQAGNMPALGINLAVILRHLHAQVFSV